MTLKIYLFPITLICLLYEKYKSNESKIKDFFNQIRHNIENIKNKCILNFKEEKDIFLDDLNRLNDISEREIIYLNNNQFQDNFINFINIIKK